MQSYLILVRHAAVQIDPSIPSHEWPLTPDGRSASHHLAQKLTPYQPHRIITSH
jgi:broad specificity phosphatase PhoE